MTEIALANLPPVEYAYIIVGERYNIGGSCELTNLNVALTVCCWLDRLHPREDCQAYEKQITFVADRPGHDFRYAVDTSKISNELGWAPLYNFEVGIAETVQWYLDQETWWREVLSGVYDGRRQGIVK